jgi:uncharacterized protein
MKWSNGTNIALLPVVPIPIPIPTPCVVKTITTSLEEKRYAKKITTTNIFYSSKSLSFVLSLIVLLLWWSTHTYTIEAYCGNYRYPKQNQQQQQEQRQYRVGPSAIHLPNDIGSTVLSFRSTAVVLLPPHRSIITSSSTTTLYAWHNNKNSPRGDDRYNKYFITPIYRNCCEVISSTSIFNLWQHRYLSNQCCTSSTTLFMGKGDGKKKRTKKNNDDRGENSIAGTTSSSSSSSSSQPLRVSSNINVPVRQQIAIAQMNKMIRQQQQSITSSSSSSSTASSSTTGGGSTVSSQSFIPVSKARVRTAYRRTWEEEEIVQKAEERKRRGQEPNWDVILNRTAVSPLLIVDGYNIIHAWPRLKKHMLKGDPSRARQLLIDDLENLQSIKGWRIECVFDGTRRSTIGPLGSGPGSTSSTSNGVTGMVNPITRGIDQATKQSVSKYGVRVVFSGVGMEADTYIEGRCIRAKNVTNGEITGSLIVATDDAMIRLSGQNAGAVCMSSSRFVDELKAVQKAVAYRVEAAVAKVNGHAIRPEQLRGNMNQVAMPTRFGRRSVLIEDKRNRTKTSKKDDMIDEEYETYISSVIQQQLEEDENGIPWWAKVSEQANANLYKRS